MPHTSSPTFLRELDKKLWTAADKLRSNLDAAAYKHAVLGQLFTNTQIPACIWFLTKNKAKRERGTGVSPVSSNNHSQDGRAPLSALRDRRGETLFIDARNLGFMKDRVLRDFTKNDIEKIAETFRAWRASPNSAYADASGFSKSANLSEIISHGHVLTPGRYVGAEDVEDDGEAFDEKMARLTAELAGQFAESAELEFAIKANLKGLGYAL